MRLKREKRGEKKTRGGEGVKRMRSRTNLKERKG